MVGSADDLDPIQIDTLRNGVRLIALRVLRDEDVAQDVAQETMSRAIAAFRQHRLEDPSRLGAFVHGIAHHVIADVIRSRRQEASLASDADLAADEPGPLVELLARERDAFVRAALLSLGDADRDILRLAFVEGFTSADIARRLGIPHARVRKQKSRALERLRAALTHAQPAPVRGETREAPRVHHTWPLPE